MALKKLDAGVHQNLTFPVQPDPISGMHGWRLPLQPGREVFRLPGWTPFGA